MTLKLSFAAACSMLYLSAASVGQPVMQHVNAFGPDTRVSSQASGRHDLAGAWLLMALNGERPELKRPIRIEFKAEDHRVAGFAGCNRFSGSWNADGSKLVFSKVISTKMACPGPAMQWEDRFLKMLGGVTNYRVAGSNLLLIGDDGTVVAQFDRE